MVESCTEYRSAQQLLALKKRLADGKLKVEEKVELEKLIKKIEKELGLD